MTTLIRNLIKIKENTRRYIRKPTLYRDEEVKIKRQGKH